MSKPEYNRKKVRRAVLIAPAAALIGLLPFVFQLNLSLVQFLVIALVALVVSYLTGILFGAPGYLTLRYFGYAQTGYLVAYAVLLVGVITYLLGDLNAVLFFGPPTLIAVAAFCFVRGSPIHAPDYAQEGASDET